MVLIGNSFFGRTPKTWMLLQQMQDMTTTAAHSSFGVVKMELQVVFGMIPLHKRP